MAIRYINIDFNTIIVFYIRTTITNKNRINIIILLIILDNNAVFLDQIWGAHFKLTRRLRLDNGFESHLR